MEAVHKSSIGKACQEMKALKESKDSSTRTSSDKVSSQSGKIKSSNSSEIASSNLRQRVNAKGIDPVSSYSMQRTDFDSDSDSDSDFYSKLTPVETVSFIFKQCFC